MKSKFYDLLNKNEEFCKALGRVTLAASKLEIELKQYLRSHGKEVSEKRATLGNLISFLKKMDISLLMVKFISAKQAYSGTILYIIYMAHLSVKSKIGCFQLKT